MQNGRASKANTQHKLTSSEINELLYVDKTLDIPKSSSISLRSGDQ